MSDPSHSTPLVIGIGVVANGLEDLQRFFATLGGVADTAFVLVPQLEANGCSLLLDLVQLPTALQIVEVTTRATLNEGYIYLCPAGGLAGQAVAES